MRGMKNLLFWKFFMIIYVIIYECFIQSKIIKVYIYLLCLYNAYLYIINNIIYVWGTGED